MKQGGWMVVCRFLAVLFLSSMLLLLRWQGNTSAEALRVGVVREPGCLMLDDKGYYSGYTYEYMQTLAEYGNWTFVYIEGSWQKNLERLQHGEIDLLPGVGDTAKNREQMVLSRLPMGRRHIEGDSPEVQLAYLGISKEAVGLQQAVNAAQNEMEWMDPDLQYRLYKKYYWNESNDYSLVLTPEERSYLQQKKKLVAVGTPGQRPHSYFKDGAYHGNIAEIMQRIAEDLGIEIEFIQTTNNEESFALLAEGKADIITELYNDYNWGKQHHLQLSTPYMEVNYVSMMQRGTILPEKPRVALARGHFYPQAFVSKLYPPEQCVYFNTLEDCLQAVRDGKADITFMKASIAQYSIWQGGYSDLMTGGDIAFSHTISIGISDKEDPMLLHIINKEIHYMDPDFIEHIADKSLLDSRQTTGFRALLYAYPLQFFAGSLLLGLSIILFLLYFMQIRRHHTQRIRYLAYADPETGLHNRSWFEQEVPGILERFSEERRMGQLVLVTIGISRMDILIESYGRKFVIEQLRRIASSLLRTHPWVLETAVTSYAGQLTLLCCMPEQGIFRVILKKMMQEYAPIRYGELKVRLHLKAGICSIPAMEVPLQQLMSCADTACGELYGTTRHVQIFDERLQKRLVMHQQIEGHMENALKQKEFEV